MVNMHNFVFCDTLLRHIMPVFFNIADTLILYWNNLIKIIYRFTVLLSCVFHLFSNSVKV
jgi:hypothetical protein